MSDDKRPDLNLKARLETDIVGWRTLTLMYDIIETMLVNTQNGNPIDRDCGEKLDMLIPIYAYTYSREDLAHVIYNLRHTIILNYLENVYVWSQEMPKPEHLLMPHGVIGTGDGNAVLVAHAFAERNYGNDYDFSSIKKIVEGKTVLDFRGGNGYFATAFAEFEAKHVYHLEGENVRRSFDVSEALPNLSQITELSGVPQGSIEVIWLSNVFSNSPVGIGELMHRFKDYVAPKCAVVFHEMVEAAPMMLLHNYRRGVAQHPSGASMEGIAHLIQWSLAMSDSTTMHVGSYFDLARETRNPEGSRFSGSAFQAAPVQDIPEPKED